MNDEASNSVPLTAVPSVAAGFRLQFEKIQDIWVLLYPEGMVKLNPSAAEILQRCDGTRNVTDIVVMLEKAFEQTGLESDVLAFLDTARQQRWITMT